MQCLFNMLHKRKAEDLVVFVASSTPQSCHQAICCNCFAIGERPQNVMHYWFFFSPKPQFIKYATQDEICRKAQSVFKKLLLILNFLFDFVVRSQRRNLMLFIAQSYGHNSLASLMIYQCTAWYTVVPASLPFCSPLALA